MPSEVRYQLRGPKSNIKIDFSFSRYSTSAFLFFYWFKHFFFDLKKLGIEKYALKTNFQNILRVENTDNVVKKKTMYSHLHRFCLFFLPKAHDNIVNIVFIWLLNRLVPTKRCDRGT